jgi:hypothetical protein
MVASRTERWCTTASPSVMYASKAAAGDSLLVVVVFGDNLHHVGHKVDGVEAHTELTDEIQVTTLLGHLQEGCKQRETSDQLLVILSNQAFLPPRATPHTGAREGSGWQL